MKRSELLELVKIHNEEWYPFVYDYLHNIRDDLPRGLLNDLDMNLSSKCMVGEVFGFNSQYEHDDERDTVYDNVWHTWSYCDTCDRIANNLFEYSKDQSTKLKFKIELIKFYRHMRFIV